MLHAARAGPHAGDSGAMVRQCGLWVVSDGFPRPQVRVCEHVFVSVCVFV